MSVTATRIAPEILAEQWFGFVHDLIGAMQSAYRTIQPKINQKMIAARLGKKPSFVSRCLAGQTNMTIRTMHDLARAMDCRLEITFRPLATLKPVNRKPALDLETLPRIPAIEAVTASNAIDYRKSQTNGATTGHLVWSST